MRINWNNIKIVFLLVIVVFLYAFSSVRNGARKITEPKIEFVGEQNLFITHDDVSKLLIQNQLGGLNITKEALDLNGLEKRLLANPMIDSAEVYVSVNGEFTAKIKQKKPIARVSTGQSFYIDSHGGVMPLSNNYTERVPLVTGAINKNELENVFIIANKVYNDEFLKKNVIQIHQKSDKTIELKLRQSDFVVQLGTLNHLDKKVNNLRAFYKKIIKDKAVNKYSKVNLQFDNQVVCTKV
ncbi:MAG: cell division protein FtsQ/DivIB [Bizionia paragorgiae]|uniref:Cell division protein FtsQ n=1 Tax=Bizionia paragorgiae TaxID=283786 RepID=A0A1H4APH1_BIZPA|nr:cell division protein FtsQ/DivIB [Bizionia paragorgiae]MDX1271013.1 cell division protein FtsQ/DivIB [Bizionia paragorgiae]SEA37688.1 cell division protein FtsQ [Bizionia paragorgiae]